MKYARRYRPGGCLAVCITILLLAGSLLCGCGKTGKTGAVSAGTSPDSAAPQDPAGKRLQVVATIFPQYDFARQIAGDAADVYMLLKPGEEVHSYEPTPQDIRMIQDSDLFIYTGGENDVWVENILESVQEDGPAAVRLLDLVDTYAEEKLEGMMSERGHDHDHAEEGGEEDHDPAEETAAEEDHDHDHAEEETSGTGGGSEVHSHVHEEEPDEHVWTSPENCVIMIEKLTEVFCRLDPAQAEAYRANGDACRTAFEELDAKYREMAGSAVRKTILFGDRFPFRYLAEELGLTCYAAFSGCSSESEPSAATIAFLIDKAAEEKLPVVFKIELSNGNIARAISEAARVKTERQLKKARDQKPAGAAESSGEPQPVQVLQLHSCQNVTRDEFSSGETCLSLMTKNLEALRRALY